MEASPEQLQEYESQLADIEELLKDAPGDESLLSLKSDLIELVALTKDTLATAGATAPVETNDGADAADDAADSKLASSLQAEVPMTETLGLPTSTDFSGELEAYGIEGAAAVPAEDQAVAAASGERPKKKVKKIKDFEVPQKFLVLETDSEADIKKKRRAVKELKRKHKGIVKEAESQKKKKSWQSFQKKKKSKDDSIFSTHDGDAKVGVVSSRSNTAFSERTRHTY